MSRLVFNPSHRPRYHVGDVLQDKKERNIVILVEQVLWNGEYSVSGLHDENGAVAHDYGSMIDWEVIDEDFNLCGAIPTLYSNHHLNDDKIAMNYLMSTGQIIMGSECYYGI